MAIGRKALGFFIKSFIFNSLPIIETAFLMDGIPTIRGLSLPLFSVFIPRLSTVVDHSFSVKALPVAFPSFNINSILELTWNFAWIFFR